MRFLTALMLIAGCDVAESPERGLDCDDLPDVRVEISTPAEGAVADGDLVVRGLAWTEEGLAVTGLNVLGIEATDDGVFDSWEVIIPHEDLLAASDEEGQVRLVPAVSTVCEGALRPVDCATADCVTITVEQAEEQGVTGEKAGTNGA